MTTYTVIVKQVYEYTVNASSKEKAIQQVINDEWKYTDNIETEAYKEEKN